MSHLPQLDDGCVENLVLRGGARGGRMCKR